MDKGYVYESRMEYPMIANEYGMKNPVQNRSKKSLDLILNAAYSLMETTPFDMLPIKSIINEAGVPTGSFYARFKDKYSLLAYLYEHYLDALEDQVGHLIMAKPSETVSGDISRLVSAISHIYEIHAPVLRSSYLHLRNSKWEEYSLRPFDTRYWNNIETLSNFLVSSAKKNDWPGIPEHVDHALIMFLGNCREHILFKEKYRAKAFSRDYFHREMVYLLECFLQRE